MNNYRVLIIEDNEALWAKPMEKFLKKFLLENKMLGIIDIAITADDARKKMREQHYHFISYDQNLPDRIGGQVTTDVGAALLKESSKRYPCSKHVAYTGYDTTKIKSTNSAIIDVWVKGFDDTDSNEFTAKTWAKKVAGWLQTNYESFYFAQASSSLPPYLAKLSQNLIAQKNDISNLYDSLQFCDLTLRLAATQAMAIAKTQNVVFQLPSDDNLLSLTDKLNVLLPQLEINNWKAYLPVTQDNTIDTNTIKSLATKVYNYQKQLYEKTPESLLSEQADIKDCLHNCMTIAAFWTGFPFITQLKHNINTWEGELILGNITLWKKIKIPINSEVNINTEHVYLSWKDNTDFNPIDLTPFVVLEYDKILKRNKIWVLCSQQNGNWIYWSLLDGKIKARKPAVEEAMMLSGA